MEILTEDDKLGLSKEEIAAIESEEGDDLDDLNPISDEEAAKLEADEAEAKAKADMEAAAKSEAVDDSKVVGEPTVVIPSFPSVPQDELDRLKATYDEAKEKYDDGDIDYDELSEAKDRYREALWKTDFAREANQNIVNSVWQRSQNEFLDANPDYRDNQTLNVVFVAAVNRIVRSEENATLTDRQVLQKAKEAVEKDLGIGSREKKRADLSADAAGRQAAETAGRPGEFDYLDKLEGAAYQNAIGKLTPEQLARYEDL